MAGSPYKQTNKHKKAGNAGKKRVIQGTGKKSKTKRHETREDAQNCSVTLNNTLQIMNEKTRFIDWINVIMDEESGQLVMGDVVCEGMTVV